jgi:hypothetical protein
MRRQGQRGELEFYMLLFIFICRYWKCRQQYIEVISLFSNMTLYLRLWCHVTKSTISILSLICFVRKSIFLASDNPSFAFDVILLWDIHSSNDSIYLFYDISKVSDCHVFKKNLKIKATIYCRQCVYEFLYFIIDNCKPVGCHFLFCIAVIMSWRHTIKIENRDLKWLIDTCNSVQSNLFYWRTNFPVSIYENAQTIPPFYTIFIIFGRHVYSLIYLIHFAQYANNKIR